MALWMSRCWNLVLQTTMFRASAKSNSLTSARTDSETKDTFLPELRVEISEDNLDVVGRAFVIEFLQVRVEGILDGIVLCFDCGLRANQAYIVELCLDANFGQQFIQRGEI